MKNSILFLFFLLSLTCCNTKKNDTKNNDANLVQEDAKIISCNPELSVNVEIWHHTGNENLIGSFHEKIENKYVQSIKGWDTDNSPYPKKFDVKINIQNNLLAYEQEENSNKKIENYTLNVILKLKVGQGSNALYPLNSKIYEKIEIIKDKDIKSEDFTARPPDKNYYLEIWKKDISFDGLYEKYNKEGLFINQLVFEIALTNKDKNNICNYEYVFPMAEVGEP